MFGLTLTLRHTFLEAMPSENGGWRSGQIVDSGICPVPVPVLEANKGSVFTFYVRSESALFVQIQMPEHVTAQLPDSTELVQLPLMLSLPDGSDRMHFFPVVQQPTSKSGEFGKPAG